MTFANGENPFLGGMRGPLKNRESDVNIFKRMIGTGDLSLRINSCETGGGRTREPAADAGQQVETEPAENFDESTPCGCQHSKYQAGNQKQSIIPVQNIQRLHQTSTITTLRAVIEKFVRN